MLRSVAISLLALLLSVKLTAADDASKTFQHFIWSEARGIPCDPPGEWNHDSSVIAGKNRRLYVSTAHPERSACLVEFDPQTGEFRTVVDGEKSIEVDRKGVTAQAECHTRDNVGKSGRIYFGTRQRNSGQGKEPGNCSGGRPTVFDRRTGKFGVYDIPVPGHGIISIVPDESRGVAYVSTGNDRRPGEGTHFMVLDLESGDYQNLLHCRHMHASIVVDWQGRAYHPAPDGNIVRYDPRTDKVERLKQTIDGNRPTDKSLLAAPDKHPVNWELSPDRKTLYSAVTGGDQLYAYDLTSRGNTLRGRSLGPLIPEANKTECRAMCVAPDGTIWAGVAATFKERGEFLHVMSWRPGSDSPVDHGPVAIGNPVYAESLESTGSNKRRYRGLYRLSDGTLLPRPVVMGICAASDGTVYLTTPYPLTLHEMRIPKVAGLTTVYRHNSHADMFFTRILKTDRLNGTGATPPLRLTSIHTDQVHENDISRKFAAEHDVRVSESIDEALTLVGEDLAVDGVLLVAEHGKYPESDTGQFQFPKRRMFEKVVETFHRTGRVVPVFHDKHLSDNWKDAKWIYDKAQDMGIPMMAGSSLPGTWRYPTVDVKRGEKLKQIVVTSYHRLDSYGFHALEIVQALAERRSGGETGVRSVRCISGEDVWKAGERGVYDRRLLDAALSRLKEKPIPDGKQIEELVRHPDLLIINYEDGLRACVFSLNYAVLEWAGAWQYESDDRIESTVFWTQELRPFMHFSWMLMDIEKMMHTGKPAWPVERTLMSSGVLDALLISRRDGGRLINTPWLNIEYQSHWNWHQPPAPPPGRPITEQ